MMISRILIIHTAFLGDVVLTTPLIKATRKLFPHSFISFLLIPQTENIVENNPHLNEIIVYDKKGKEKGPRNFFKMVEKIKNKNFDLAIIPHRYLRSALLTYLAGIPQRIGFDKSKGSFLFTHKVTYKNNYHEVDRNLSLLNHFGDDPQDRTPELFPSFQDYSYVSQLLRDSGVKENDRIVGVAPGSVWATKRWLPERFALVSDFLIKEAGAQVIFLGSKQDEKLCREIANLMEGKPIILSGKTSLLQSAAIISKCKVILSNDSAPVHLASAMRRPVVAIFGSTIPEFGFAPYGEGNVVIEKRMECRPCGIHGKNNCPKKHFRCMAEIATQEVFEALLTKLSIPG
ncbi:MAG: lipopolysaccharide heptosyltransferase II [Candidatus Zixiibacteriota bacterium]